MHMFRKINVFQKNKKLKTKNVRTLTALEKTHKNALIKFALNLLCYGNQRRVSPKHIKEQKCLNGVQTNRKQCFSLPITGIILGKLLVKYISAIYKNLETY